MRHVFASEEDSQAKESVSLEFHRKDRTMTNDRANNAGRRLLLALAVLSVVSGCALRPDSASWDKGQPTIGPTPPSPSGYLTVETPESGSPDNGEQPHEQFFVYDHSGKYYDRYNNNVFLPIGLPPGRYSVVTRYRGENRKVQVEIRNGCSTIVRLDDFRNAPVIR